ncbi:hypothetical protein GF1_09670 [Desulfolithobacter dissulfuricans]|uniref:Helix-turn-helix domain-containing protein n=2 Tax=Desulfolithobacter dissulfuricans TaxID=2795293 RepID=A0A915XKQ7_9BACT|nr:hypothetical protein GF1_09670 [Desulfolithobacter dissulfuricans]
MKTRKPRIRKVRRKLQPIALNGSDAGRYLGISESMMRKMRSDGSGPPYKTIGRKIVYLRSDLQQWLENK